MLVASSAVLGQAGSSGELGATLHAEELAIVDLGGLRARRKRGSEAALRKALQSESQGPGC